MWGQAFRLPPGFRPTRRAKARRQPERAASRCTASMVAVASVVLLGSCKPSNGPQTRHPLNLVLVTIDTLRADRLGCYGNSNIETPNLDRIARQGVLFENAVTHTPLTPPSHASIFT